MIPPAGLKTSVSGHFVGKKAEYLACFLSNWHIAQEKPPRLLINPAAKLAAWVGQLPVLQNALQFLSHY
ncbi:MAG TPA: hypothetical protein DHW22_04900 [Planctomycetaceae bacterium]|nr:hypothetical protein [Planctomycetaceae bacterium]